MGQGAVWHFQIHCLQAAAEPFAAEGEGSAALPGCYDAADAAVLRADEPVSSWGAEPGGVMRAALLL